MADRWAEQLIPADLDWQDLVRQFPKIALAVAAAGGFVIGRFHGQEILGAVSNAVANRIHRAVDGYAGYARRQGG